MATNNDSVKLKHITSFGLSELKATETLKNPQLTATLLTILQEVDDNVESHSVGILLYHLATKLKPALQKHLPKLVLYIATHKLDTTLRIDKAIEYLLQNAMVQSINWPELETYCGVGITVTPAEIERAVEMCLKPHHKEILAKRYRFNAGPVMQAIKGAFPWADGKAVKNELDVQILDLLGPKTEADLTTTKTTNSSSNSSSKKQPPTLSVAAVYEDPMKKVQFHVPGENYKTDDYVITPQTHNLLREHLKVTGGRVITRFPPEPNGILHIGHAKAININFGYARAHQGYCYLRYDDTNPEKEEEKFFSGIREMVEWLGYKPHKITHSSDYFEQLYKWAVQLIRADLAYVCHQSAEEVRGFNAPPSPWRNRPISDSLQLFEDMRNGKMEEGAATLRLKLTLEEGKIDPVAYRVRYTAHARTGDYWCVYPTYDFTHCLCDSLENVTHSLCTKEFQSRRSSYYWLCNALNIYCPVQWEYGRLNVNYTVVSKRKIAKLIDSGLVKDWDDPRLYTLTALRRRGFPPQAINNFCVQLGVTGAQCTVDPQMLEAYVRDHLNSTAPRRMVVLQPLKITIQNLGTSFDITIPDFPGSNPANKQGSYTIQFRPIIYIEQSDFCVNSTQDFRRLTPQQSVGLRYANYVLKFKSFNEQDGLICDCVPVEQASVKPKAFIHWVSDTEPIEIRVYSPLFKHRNPEDPNEVPDGFLRDCNVDSLHVYSALMNAKSLEDSKIYDKFQFERLGYFSVDPDTTKHLLVVNKTVALREDPGKC